MTDINDFLLNLFTGSDNSHPEVMFPNCCNDFVSATDRQILITIPAVELRLKYGTNPEYPNVLKLIEDLKKEKLSSFEVNIADLELELTKARLYIDKLKCNECAGTGAVDFEYEDGKEEVYYLNGECPVCEGHGYVDSQSDFPRVHFEMDPENDTPYIKIGGLRFNPFQLYKIFLVAALRMHRKINICYGELPTHAKGDGLGF